MTTSRKKAKGKARKAAQAQAEKEKARESIRLLQQSQIQRLQISNQSSTPTTCRHGYEYDPFRFPDDEICIEFIRSFVREFYKCMLTQRRMSKGEWGVIEAILEARDVTSEYNDVWYNADKINWVISYFLHNGVVLVLEDKGGYARHSALFARFFEQWLAWEVHKSQHCINIPKVVECWMAQSDEHTVVKFFWRRIRCSCLDERYEEVKSIPKMGTCFNSQCEHPKRSVERSELRCCSRCRMVNYCSRKCQAADWSSHKDICEAVAASKAEFDSSQQLVCDSEDDNEEVSMKPWQKQIKKKATQLAQQAAITDSEEDDKEAAPVKRIDAGKKDLPVE
jgi:hypothetical protein